jgi:hypothetical protein
MRGERELQEPRGGALGVCVRPGGPARKKSGWRPLGSSGRATPRTGRVREAGEGKTRVGRTRKPRRAGRAAGWRREREAPLGHPAFGPVRGGGPVAGRLGWNPQGGQPGRRRHGVWYAFHARDGAAREPRPMRPGECRDAVKNRPAPLAFGWGAGRQCLKKNNGGNEPDVRRGLGRKGNPHPALAANGWRQTDAPDRHGSHARGPDTDEKGRPGADGNGAPGVIRGRG